MIGGETAEMPGMYSGGDYDLPLCRRRGERGQLLPAGDIAKATSSSGLPPRACTRTAYSLVRKIVRSRVLPGMLRHLSAKALSPTS